MTERVKSTVTESAKSVAPWKKGVTWWVVLVEGLVLLGLGLYMFFAQDSTFRLLGWIVAIALAVSGGFDLYLSIRAEQGSPARQWMMIRGAVGLAAGVIVMLLLLFDVLLVDLGIPVLGLGCLGYGGVGLYMLIDKKLAALQRMSVVGVIFFLVLGVLLLLQWLGVGTLVTTIQIVNLLIAIGGIALILWAIILRREGAQPASPAASTGA